MNVSPMPAPTTQARMPRVGRTSRSVVTARWMQAAACRYTDPEVFFPEAGEPAGPARRICQRCPVQPPCQRWVLATAAPYGVLGGHTVGDRSHLATEIRGWALAELLPCPPRGPVPPAVQDAYQLACSAGAA